ncbi:2'-5' RNA ligase family protein [Fimbriiglobus ruber]|uniref:2'-5' RNA ligase family protein n=1 Tax=Fimbriiglobus ruber TaxID=1908690 RepID=UPI00117A8CE6|nr:2'-5' RNA ligase family protein [Fimbriiglobus ruber]
MNELDLDGEHTGEFLLCGPAFREPDLLWLSVEPDGPGTAVMQRLHGLLMNAFGTVVIRDETSAAHAGSGYRPHVTLAWGATEGTLIGLGRDDRGIAVTATLEKVVLAEYPDTWPASGSVTAVAELRHRLKSVRASH